MYVYLFLKMGVWVTNSSIIKLLLSSNLLFSNFSCASDWRDFSDDKVPELLLSAKTQKGINIPPEAL